MKITDIPTPSYVIDEKKLRENLEILQQVKQEAGCRILLAQKAFSAFCEYPLIGKYLDGTTSSGLFEARLGYEEMGKENHIFSPAYRPEEIEEIAGICGHVIFNSFSQLSRFGRIVAEIHRQQEGKEARVSLLEACSGMAQDQPSGSKGADAEAAFKEPDGGRDSVRDDYVGTGIGLRLNPECSTQEGHAIYDPCAPGSRLGITRENFDKGMEQHPEAFSLVDGLHIHTLCEQDSDALEETIRAVEEKFGDILRLPQVRWLNLGGGHHITREGYDIGRLVKVVRHLRETYDVSIYLEPGEAVALNAGYLVTEVMDRVENGITTLILDASAACHMPDVLEMPYRPPLKDAGVPGEKKYTFRLASLTCLAGDMIGDYSFDRDVQPGERLYFEDMAIYSMVKNNTFNGIGLPSIYAMDEDGNCRLVKKFGYEDFKMRLS